MCTAEFFLLSFTQCLVIRNRWWFLSLSPSLLKGKPSTRDIQSNWMNIKVSGQLRLLSVMFVFTGKSSLRQIPVL